MHEIADKRYKFSSMYSLCGRRYRCADNRRDIVMFIKQVTDQSSAAYRLAGMEELRWIPDPGMCFIVTIVFIFVAGPKVFVVSIIPWLVSLNLIDKYNLGGITSFLLAGAVIGVLVGWTALPLLWFAQHPSYTRIISL